MGNLSKYSQELYEEMCQDDGIQYDNDCVAEELLESFWD